MQQKDYYKILGVAENAPADEIKKAYRELAKKFHPDKNAGNAAAEAKFKEANEAYEVLGNEEKRRKYDELRKYASGGGGAGSMSYEEFMRKFGGQKTSEDDTNWGFGNVPLNDIFSNLFGGMGGGGFHFQSGGGSRRASGRQRRAQTFDFMNSSARATEPQPTDDPFFKRLGNDAYIDMNINLAQALLGSKVRVRTPDGKKVVVNIPSGTQPETVLRVTGMGYNGGNLYIRTHLAIPKSLTDEQKDKAKDLAEELGMKW